MEDEHDILDQIDWENFLQSIPDSIDLFTEDLNLLSDPSIGESVQETSNPTPNSDPSCFGEIEHFLLEDDIVIEENRVFSEDFFSDILLDVSNEEIPSPKPNSVEEKEKSDVSEESNGDEDSQTNKKRKRQMRNRDSAMRSRERKKMYVRDLEIKSKYLEGECKRLEYALSCCIMENQILQQRLQKDQACGISVTKQESAVLSLESLLLGSLFWIVSVACLFLPSVSPLTKSINLVMGNADRLGGSNGQEIAEVRKAGNEVGLLDFMKRRCKAIRTKVKVVVDFLSLARCCV